MSWLLVVPQATFTQNDISPPNRLYLGVKGPYTVLHSQHLRRGFVTKVGILNVTGYAGAEVARILHGHPEVEVVSVTGRNSAGQNLREVFPHLSNLDLAIDPELSADVDVVFSCLPHKASAEKVIPLLEAGVKVVDMSADFRLKDPREYEAWYEETAPPPQYLAEAIYGLTELHRSDVSQARLVANPGCYPTSATLALAPAIKEGIIESDIVIDSKSGVSGSGRTLNLSAHFSEVNENLIAYSVNGHRHLPEITQELGRFTQPAPKVTFVPHLVPMTRGILSSCYARLREDTIVTGQNPEKAIVTLYRDFYQGDPFVKVTPTPPQTKQTWGSNSCLMYPTVDMRTGKLVVISCIDNLVKGAAGQAVQNMNLMLGFRETTGLEALAIYP